MQNTKIWPSQSSTAGISRKQPSLVSDCDNFWGWRFYNFPFVKTSTCKRPPMVRFSWVTTSRKRKLCLHILGGRLLCKDWLYRVLQLKGTYPSCPKTHTRAGGGWVEGGSRQAALVAVVRKQFSTQHLRLLFSQCFVFTLDDEQTARIYSPPSAYFFVVWLGSYK